MSIFPFIIWFLSALNWFRIKVLHICEFVEQWFDTCRVCKIWSQAWNNETILHCIESTFNTVQYTPNIKDFGCQRLTILHERPKPFFRLKTTSLDELPGLSHFWGQRRSHLISLIWFVFTFIWFDFRDFYICLFDWTVDWFDLLVSGFDSIDF